MTVPFVLPPLSFVPHQDQASPSSSIRSLSSSVRLDGLSSGSKGGGPAFVGQVFSMLDPSGNGLMAVTTHFDIPFLSKRTPGWIKKMLAFVTKSEQNGPVFRFFMDLSDAVAHVKQLNVPTGMVGACRLDVAYEHFKEKPHMFQFVPNKKQVKAANDLLKRIPRKDGRRKLAGVPVFTAQNLNIAIATNDGIKWYTPYFFDKHLLDNILEASIDQHFNALIQSRHKERRRDGDDSDIAEMAEENGDELFNRPEVKEVVNEIVNDMVEDMSFDDIPWSAVSKAAEIKLLDGVDKVLLGNKWLRKATGIQPKFPYLVDSFEERSASAFTKDGPSISSVDVSEPQQLGASDDCIQAGRGQSTYHNDFRFPFSDWFRNPWSRLHQKQQIPDNIGPDMRMSGTDMEQPRGNPLLPKITMVGISMGEGGNVSRANLKKTMEDMTEELKYASQKSLKPNEANDPLFVANVGDYSSITRMSTS